MPHRGKRLGSCDPVRRCFESRRSLPPLAEPTWPSLRPVLDPLRTGRSEHTPLLVTFRDQIRSAVKCFPRWALPAPGPGPRRRRRGRDTRRSFQTRTASPVPRRKTRASPPETSAARTPRDRGWARAIAGSRFCSLLIAHSPAKSDRYRRLLTRRQDRVHHSAGRRQFGLSRN